MKKRPWALALGLVSLTTSMASAYFVYYLQGVYLGQLVVTGSGAIPLLSWLPIVALFLALLIWEPRKREQPARL